MQKAICEVFWSTTLILALTTAAHGQTHGEAVLELPDQIRALHEPAPAPEPTPEPTPAGVPAMIAAMAPGSWLAYGAPWDEAAPAQIPCNKRFRSILSSWNGWARDGLRYVYVAASGGHGDGCDNGV